MLVKIDKVKPYPGNARRGDVEMIRASLRKHGQYRPLVVQKSTDLILAGNHTWLAAQAEGYTEVDIHYVDCDDHQARQIVLIDNKANDEAGYDPLALTDLLKELDGDFEGTGFEKVDLDKMLDSLSTTSEKADRIPIGNIGSRVSEGDIWILGDHRLVCGSALEPADLALALNGDAADLIVTSPPYNQQLDSFKASGMQKENPAWVERMADAYDDSLPEPEYQDQQRQVLQNLADIARDGASLFYNHKVRYRDKAILHPFEWLPFVEGPHSSWRIRQEIIWDRMGSITLNAKMLMPQDERIFWLTKGNDFTWVEDTEIKSWGTVWQIAPKVDVQISAPFPTEIPMRCIRIATERDAVVVDPYGGSGTTLIAAEQLGRSARLVEFNPAYCDVILSRWEGFTGRKAERET